MIRPNEKDRPVSPSWVQVYRELVEWAILTSSLKKDFGTDTLIVCDGLLRSKVFAGDLFQRLLQEIKRRIEDQFARNRRRIYLAGVAKHSKVFASSIPNSTPPSEITQNISSVPVVIAMSMRRNLMRPSITTVLKRHSHAG